MDAFRRELTAAQWRKWCEFFDLEPSGNLHDDLCWGLLLSLMVNLQRTKSSSPLSRPEDWFPGLAPARRARGQTAEEQVARWRALAAATRHGRVR